MNLRITSLLVATILWLSSSLAAPIDVNQARLLAEPYMKEASAKPLLVKKSASQTDHQPVYIFSRGKGQGFVIVSGDDALPSILGYAESGDFIEEQMPPQLLAFIETYSKISVEASAKHSPKYVSATATDKQDIAPLIKTHWHQDSPYNLRCPMITGTSNRSIVGCVATAASQVLYYFHKDAADVMQGSTPTYSYGDAPVTESIKVGTPLKWDLMQNSYSGSEPQEYRDVISTFCFAVGSGTWLTYGSSTGGHISDLPATFSNYFGMTAKHMYMSSTTQAGWENRIYDELQNGRPMVFSGYTSDWKIGHAIVLDGYQKNGNLFHFNFGWGGQADGFYTIVDGRGPGDYGTGQEIVYNITPKKYNLAAGKIGGNTLYQNRTNTLSFAVANNGTLDYSGIYMFCTTSSASPSKLSSATAKDETTVIAGDGKEVLFDFTFKPIIEGLYHIYLTDKNLNVLSKTDLRTSKPQNLITFKNMALKSAREKEGDYALIYNTKAEIGVYLADKSDIPYEGSMRMDVYGSNDNGKTFSYVGYNSFSVTSDGNTALSGVCSLSMASTSCPLETDKPYYAVPQHKTVSGDEINFEGAADTIVRFIIKGSDLSVKDFSDGCLTLQGHWNTSVFSSLAKKKDYANAVCYDLTAVTGVDAVPSVEGKPNAMFYVSEPVDGQNAIVSGGSSQSISLTAGYDFTLRSDVNAQSVTVNICQEPDKWYLFTSPATLTVPDGMIARTIDSHSIIGILSMTTDVTVLQPGRTYMLMTSSSTNQTLTGKPSLVSPTPTTNPDTAVVGTFVSTATPAGSMLINLADEQYFTPVEEGTTVEAFRGYFHASNVTKAFSTNSQIIYDPHYLTLGQAIHCARLAVTEHSKELPADTTALFVADIESAEHMFTYRTAKTQDIKSTAAALQASTDAYIAKAADNKKGRNDFTSYIVNPSFETGNTNGWELETVQSMAVRKTSSLQYKGVGADGTYLLYAYDSATKNGSGICQTISGLPAGIYSLTAMLGTDEGNKVRMFANDMEAEVDASPFGQYYLTKASIDSIEIKDGQTLTIGVRAGRWYKADDFRLTMIATASEIPGDANGDGVVDVADITAIAAYILGNTPTPFHEKAADVNNDGNIDVSDITATAGIILKN